MKNISDKSCIKKFKKSYSITFSQNRGVYEVMWKNKVQPDRQQMPNKTTQKRRDLHAG